jgi:hypothetical protein
MDNPKVIVRLLGGLGNQMFQYALGRQLSIASGRQLLLDLSFYESDAAKSTWTVRNFGLSNFKLNADVATSEDLKPFQKYLKLNFIGRVARRLSSIGKYYSGGYILEPLGRNFVFDHRLLNATLKQVIYLDGFWQSEKYFLSIEDVIRKDFAFKNEPDEVNKKMLDQINSVNSVAIHIRHGDNATKIAAKHGVLPMSYYKNAIANLVANVESPKFYIFSDDQAWAKQNLKLNFPAEFVSHNGDEKNYEDIRLMSHCKHHIIGNSTFSWWGAWLAKKPNQVVYAPERYHMKDDMATTDFYPSDWHLEQIV